MRTGPDVDRRGHVHVWGQHRQPRIPTFTQVTTQKVHPRSARGSTPDVDMSTSVHVWRAHSAPIDHEAYERGAALARQLLHPTDGAACRDALHHDERNEA